MPGKCKTCLYWDGISEAIANCVLNSQPNLCGAEFGCSEHNEYKKELIYKKGVQNIVIQLRIALLGGRTLQPAPQNSP